MALTFNKGQLSAGIKHGYRSGLEERNAELLIENGVPARFEPIKLPYRIERNSTYMPDFVLENGIIIESKGRFMSKDRVKHMLIKKQHPDLDIRFVFSNSRARLSKTSKTTYGKWCDTKGFLFSDKTIPKDWMFEKPNEKSKAALRALGYEFGDGDE